MGIQKTQDKLFILTTRLCNLYLVQSVPLVLKGLSCICCTQL